MTLRILLLTLIFSISICSCKKTEEDEITQNSTGGTAPSTNANLRNIIFTFEPVTGSISGRGKVFYEDAGVKTYIFGAEFNNQSWTGSNTAQITSVSLNVPRNLKVVYSFTADTSPFTPPLLSVSYKPSGGSPQVLIQPSTNLSGTFNAPN